MKDFEIKLSGGQSLGEKILCVDDKPVKLKKNEYGNLVYRNQTEKEKVNIKVYRMLDVGGALWFITQLFFFLITIFGIFDIHRRERCLVIDFEIDVELNEENKINLQINSPQENGKAIDVQTDLTTDEKSNKYIVETKAKKMLKGLKFTKLFSALAIIITAVVILIIKL